VVHLDQPWLQIRVYQDVDAQNLEADRVLQVVGLARPVRVAERWLPSDDRFDSYVFNLVHHVLSTEVFLVLLHVLENLREGPLVSTIVILTFAFDERP
jgi:hypothetical protein